MKNLTFKMILAVLIIIPAIVNAQITGVDNCIGNIDDDCYIIDIGITNPDIPDPQDELWIGFWETTNSIGGIVFNTVSAGSERLCETLLRDTVQGQGTTTFECHLSRH